MNYNEAWKFVNDLEAVFGEEIKDYLAKKMVEYDEILSSAVKTHLDKVALYIYVLRMSGEEGD